MKAVKVAVEQANSAGQLSLTSLKGAGKGKQLTPGKIEMVKTALEATVRVENAVAGAQDWFKRGVQIFQGELNAIGDAKRSLQDVVAKLTGEKPPQDLATPPPARHPQPRPLPAHLLKFPAFSPAPFHSLAHPTSATPPGAPSHHPSPCRFAPFSPASAVIVVVDKKQLPG